MFDTVYQLACVFKYLMQKNILTGGLTNLNTNERTHIVQAMGA